MPAYATCQRCQTKFKANIENIVCPSCNWPNEKPKPKKKKKELYTYYIEPDGIFEDTYFMLTLPVPHSNNSEPKHIMEVYKYKEYWKQQALEAWNIAGQPFFSKVKLSMRFYFPDKRKRDFTNYTGNWSIKGLMDGLKELAFPDDSSNFLELGGVTFGYDKERPRLELTLEEISETDSLFSIEGKLGIG